MFELNKQDRQAARTPADLARRYGLDSGKFAIDTAEVNSLIAANLAVEAIRARNSPVKVAFSDNKITFDLTGSDNTVDRKIEISHEGIRGMSLGPSGVLESKTWYPALQIYPAYLRHDEETHVNFIQGYASDLCIGAIPGGWGHLSEYDAHLIIGAPFTNPGRVVIEGKQVSWKDNGDGTYTLIGTDFNWR